MNDSPDRREITPADVHFANQMSWMRYESQFEDRIVSAKTAIALVGVSLRSCTPSQLRTWLSRLGINVGSEESGDLAALTAHEHSDWSLVHQPIPDSLETWKIKCSCGEERRVVRL